MKKVAIIGGGASGLCCAVMLKLRKSDLDVTIFESSSRVGRKLAVTGNGRCNISNINLSSEHFHGDPDFAERIIKNFGFENQKEFFKELGVIFCLEGDKAYPMSLQANSVVDALRFKADELGVNIMLESKITSIERKIKSFAVFADRREEQFDVVVVACGGKAGGKLGSEDGYSILKSMGHKIEKIKPSLVQLKAQNDVVRQLKGIKEVAVVTLTSDIGKRTEQGELLFCDYGISGPPVLQVSRFAEEGALVTLDLIPKMSNEEVKNEIKRRIALFPNRLASELFTGFLNKRLGQVILKISDVNINSMCCNINEKETEKIVVNLKNFKLKVTGNTGFENAQVTVGGAQTTQFFDNCMSKKVKGLFAIGEVLNVDGDCGGYNLSFAWACANAAANGIINFFKD